MANKLPHELPPNISSGDAAPGHVHEWTFAALLPHQRQHVVTDTVMTMASVIMTCTCGGQLHSWLIPPPEPQADVQRAMALQ